MNADVKRAHPLKADKQAVRMSGDMARPGMPSAPIVTTGPVAPRYLSSFT